MLIYLWDTFGIHCTGSIKYNSWCRKIWIKGLSNYKHVWFEYKLNII